MSWYKSKQGVIGPTVVSCAKEVYLHIHKMFVQDTCTLYVLPMSLSFQMLSIQRMPAEISGSTFRKIHTAMLNLSGDKLDVK